MPYETLPTPAEAQRPPQSLAELDQRLTELNEQLAPVHTVIDDIIDDDSTTDDVRDRVEEGMNAAAAEQFGDREPNTYEDLSLLLGSIQANGTDAMRSKLQKVLPSTQAALTEALSLEPVAIELSERELQDARRRLVDGTDWTTVISKYIAGTGEYGNLSSFLNSLNDDPINQVATDHRQNITRISEVEAWRQRFGQSGDLLPPGSVDAAPEGWERHAKPLDERLHGWSNLTRETFQYLSPSRSRFARREFPRFGIMQLGNLFANGTALAWSPSSERIRRGLPVNIEYAMEQNAARITGEFLEADEKFIADQEASRPNALFIGGQTYLKDHTNVDDVSSWVRLRFSRMPGNLMDTLGYLNFVQKIDPNAEPQAKWVTTGGTSISENTIQLALDRDDTGFFTGTDDPKLAKAYKRFNRADVEGDVDHESMHFMHRQRIPIRWLRGWHRTVELEPVAVTKYVKQKHADIENQHKEGVETDGLEQDGGNGNTEDLAESYRLFMNRPYTLYRNAPRRFAILNSLYPHGRYDRDWLRQADEWIKNNNPSNPEVSYGSLNSELVDLAEEPLKTAANLVPNADN